MTDASALHDLFARIAARHMLCVGDIMLDRFVYGTVHRISPEAPVPVLRIERETVMPGGVGNVARNLSALGAAATVIGVRGADSEGETLDSLLAALPRLVSKLVTTTGRPTSLKVRHVAGGQQMLRADRETTAPLDPRTEEAVCRAIADAAPACNAIILSDYAKGVLTPTVVAAACAAAKTHGIRVIADPKRNDFMHYRGVHMLTPNARELAVATGLPVATDAEAEAAARAVIAQVGLEALLVTRSAQGMTLVTREGTTTHLPAFAREVFDVSGAGDTVIATLALAMAAGTSLVEAATMANLAAGIVVGKAGTAVIRPDEIAEAMQARKREGASSKIRTAASVLDLVQTWRARGLSVGFTNGCFDLLHPGHISLLAQARKHCDRLIIGLNTDDSVRRLKGPTRPVNPEFARAIVLAALESVDAIVLFDADTPIDLIRSLRPDVLVKGADYTLAEVVGGSDVMSWGGRVVLAELAPGQSTTGIVTRMKGGAA